MRKTENSNHGYIYFFLFQHKNNLKNKLIFGLFFLIDERIVASNNHSVVDTHNVNLAKLEIKFPDIPAHLLPG